MATKSRQWLHPMARDLSERRALWAEFAVKRNVDCESPGVGWLPDGGVEVTGKEPKPLNLFLGPH